MLNALDYTKTLEETFTLLLGLPECPLIAENIGHLHALGATLSEAIDIGLDVANGVEFYAAIDRNLNHCEVLA